MPHAHRDDLAGPGCPNTCAVVLEGPEVPHGCQEGVGRLGCPMPVGCSLEGPGVPMAIGMVWGVWGTLWPYEWCGEPRGAVSQVHQ